MRGLGLSYPITLPVVGKQNIDVPVDKMATDAINAAWPVLKARLDKELPGIVAKAAPQAMGQVKTQILIAGAAIIGAVFVAAWWVKKG